MTTIVFDGKTLAADTAIYYGDTYGGVDTKVCKADIKGEVYIIAASGISANIEPFIMHLNGIPVNETFSDSRFIVIKESDHTDCRLFELGRSTPYVFPLVIGCGYDIAIGAIEAGADAVCAVKAACNRNAFTDYPIEVFRFKKKGGYKYSKIEKPA